jgi:phage gpG-like protein
MGGVKGDFAGLQGFSHKLAKLTGVDKLTAKKLAEPLSAELQRTFDAGQAPDGTPWPPTKTQGARVLNDTGALRASVTTLVAKGAKLRGSAVGYARYQQPQLFIPSAASPPPAFEQLAKEAADEALAEVAGA